MPEKTDVVVIVGSLRRASYTRRCALALIDLAPAGLALEIIPIGDLPLYNEDLETDDPPAPWRAFRDRVRPAGGVLFATPEYNRSVPSPLKNALDVGSRPYGKSVWAGKPAAVVSVSPGAIGGFGANHAIRQSLVFLDMPVLQQPEAYVGNANKLFPTENRGEMADDGTRKFLSAFIEAFAAWIERLA